MNSRYAAWAVGLVALIALPFVYREPYHLHLLVLILIWSFAYTSWSIMGRFGLVSLGHGGFMGVGAYVTAIETNPALTLAWIREFPALGEAVRPVQRRGMRLFTDMLVDLTSSPGFRRAGMHTVSRQTALILLGGLRELTAHTLEDGEDIRGITDTAVAACVALVTTS